MRDTKNRLVDDRRVLRMLALLALTACTSPRAISAGTSTASHDIVITHREAQQASVGPAENFTGTARVHRLFLPESPSRVQGAYVTFEPGAHTAWHTHPAGQILVVTVAIVEQLDGKSAAWMEKVTDAQYNGEP